MAGRARGTGLTRNWCLCPLYSHSDTGGGWSSGRRSSSSTALPASLWFIEPTGTTASTPSPLLSFILSCRAPMTWRATTIDAGGDGAGLGQGDSREGIRDLAEGT